MFPRPIAECDSDWRAGRMANRWPRRAPTLEIASAPDGAPGSCVARLCKQMSPGPIWPYSPHGAKGVRPLWRKADRGVNCCLVEFPLLRAPERGRKFDRCQRRGANFLFLHILQIAKRQSFRCERSESKEFVILFFASYFSNPSRGNSSLHCLHGPHE